MNEVPRPAEGDSAGSHGTGQWLAVTAGLVVVVFELAPIVGVGLEFVRYGPSAGNRIVGSLFLALAAGALGVLGTATKRRWLPKATALVAAGLFPAYLISIGATAI